MLKLQSALFVLLLAALIVAVAWLSQRHVIRADWTAAGRNSLSSASVELLRAIDGEVEITAYARDDALSRRAIRDLVDRYRRHKPDLELKFVDPDRNPDEVRRLDITTERELVVKLGGRSAHVTRLDEPSLTGALHRVARSGAQRILYLKGHGERDLLGKANHDLGRFGRRLENRGYTVIGVNLAEIGAIPGNADVLLLSRGEVGLLPGEAALIRRFLDEGGNLLWLADPPVDPSTAPLAESLGVDFAEGRVVELGARVLGVDDPAMVVVTRYPDHPVTRRFNLVTVFPGAAAITAAAKGGWKVTPLLETSARSRIEAVPDEDSPGGDPGTGAGGPLNIGLALERGREAGAGAPAQRVAVIGDGDFLANSYLGNGGNLELGVKLMDWLAGDDEFIRIPVRTATDLDFKLSRELGLLVAFTPLAVMPVALLAAGFLVWRRRRRR